MSENIAVIKATDQQIHSFISEFGEWSVKNNKLHRDYVFHDFVQAFGFMTEIALLVERSNHHPEWFNAYKNVSVDLTTHEVNGITERDFSLAKQMEKVAASRLHG